MLRRVAHERRFAGQAAGTSLTPSKANFSRGNVRLAAVGLALGAGLVVGASLMVLLDAPSSARELPAVLRLDAGVSGGCTTLALDRDKGRTEAEPCPQPPPQLAGTFQVPLTAATAY
jgi:hypothetical protein